MFSSRVVRFKDSAALPRIFSRRACWPHISLPCLPMTGNWDASRVERKLLHEAVTTTRADAQAPTTRLISGAMPAPLVGEVYVIRDFLSTSKRPAIGAAMRPRSPPIVACSRFKSSSDHIRVAKTDGRSISFGPAVATSGDITIPPLPGVRPHDPPRMLFEHMLQKRCSAPRMTGQNSANRPSSGSRGIAGVEQS